MGNYNFVQKYTISTFKHRKIRVIIEMYHIHHQSYNNWGKNIPIIMYFCLFLTGWDYNSQIEIDENVHLQQSYIIYLSISIKNGYIVCSFEKKIDNI